MIKINNQGFSITILRKRLLSIVLAIAFIFCAIFARFFYVQIIWAKDLTFKASDQWNREIPIIASRGIITDRNGQVLAGNKTTYSVFVRPNAVKDVDKVADALSSVLDANREKIKEKIQKKKVSEVTVARQVDKSKIESLLTYAVDGLYYAKDNYRVYSYDDALCQVLGFTSVDGMGISGLEKYYNSILAGKNGEIAYTTDIVGVQTEKSKIIYKSATDGDELRLTIDADIQLAVEDVIKRTYADTSAKTVSCVVLDAQNFEVLAMANYPSYNLNDVPRNDATTINTQSRNNLVCDVYEPGSTFKVITSAINLEEYCNGNSRAKSPSYVFNSSRTRSVDGTTVKCWSNHANGKHCNQTLAQALNTSCNPCFTDIALSIGKDTFYKYLAEFGFGKSTGIDFFGEAKGLLISQKSVRDCDLARIGFGQSVAVSQIQLACAVACAVNGGYYYTPKLLKSVISADGKVISSCDNTAERQVISSKASSMLAQMLEGVIKDGSGKNAYIEGYRVGGKTGTAQKYENGRIAVGKYVSSFVGFFPANKPKYLTLISVDEPKGAYYGSVVAAPCAKTIFERIIALKNIQPCA